MTIRDFIRGERIGGVEWLERSTDAKVSPIARPTGGVENDAPVIVGWGWAAALLEPADPTDVFSSVRQRLLSAERPILSRRRGWKHGSEGRSDADVVVVRSRRLTSVRCGTKASDVAGSAALFGSPG